MNPKIWIPLSAALVTGAAAAWTGYHLVSQKPAASTAQAAELDSVVVASRPLPAGTRIAVGDLKVLRVEKGTRLGSVERDPNFLLGRIVKDALSTGQPVTQALLADEGAAVGLTATLPQGHRAITVKLDRFQGLEGFVLPESRVDVVAALGGGKDAAARTIAQNLRVLAVDGKLKGQNIEVSGEEAAQISRDFNVTLMVTPEQAAAIELAAANGNPRLMLRSETDAELHPFTGLTMLELRGEASQDQYAGGRDVWETTPTPTPVVQESEPAPVQPEPAPPQQVGAAEAPQPAPRLHIIEVIRGGVISRTTLPAAPEAQPKSRRPERAFVTNDTSPASR